MKKKHIFLTSLTPIVLALSQVEGAIASCIFSQSAYAANEKVNFSLLIGEWSKSGECDKERYIYTSKRKYFWMTKQEGKWKTMFKGLYIPNENSGSVIIGDASGDGYGLNIHRLNQKSYIGNFIPSIHLEFENPNDAKFSYVRCPKKLM